MKEILRMQKISKFFPGVKALDKAEFSLYAGEVHALLGENGAGKSTLMKILSGVYKKDSGEIYLDGKLINLKTPRQAQELGIAIIYQELHLVSELTVMENIFLGRERLNSIGFIDETAMLEEATKVLSELGTYISPLALTSSLNIGEQQMVEIAKALSLKTKVLIMDEPTTALTKRETERLFGIIHRLTAGGVGVVYISHRMEELFTLSDRVTVMRDGAYVGTVNTKTSTVGQLIKMMVGRDITTRFPKKHSAPGSEVLRIEHLSSPGKFEDVSFTIHAGEVVGLAGLMGSGRTELARAIFGADSYATGSIYVSGHKQLIQKPEDAIHAGIGLIPEDRKQQGLILELSVQDNITLASLKQLCRLLFISTAAELKAVEVYISNLKIRTPSIGQLVKNLSGGNQQKVVIAKWLSTSPKVLIMDEPTRGIDVGAKAEIYHIMNMLTASGAGILMISSELPEILGMSERILVMHQGHITIELPVEQATQEIIMAYAAGGR